MAKKQKVYVYKGDDTTPCLSGFYMMNLSPTSSARMIGHPIEDGTTIFDDKVTQPDRVTISGEVYVSDQDTLSKIQDMLRDKAFVFYSIVSLGLEYSNMSLERVQERQSAESPDISEVTLEFQEVMQVSAQKSKPQRPEDSPTKQT